MPDPSVSLEAATRAAATKPSIAVLPFANMSADKDQDYFSDGLAEEIINLLAQISGLKVIARTSAFAFRGKDEDIRKIAEALDVTHVLEGSVRRAGRRIRVTAQLIAAADGGHLWSERYDREVSDIFALQDEIAAAIARALRVRLSGQTQQQRYVPKLRGLRSVPEGPASSGEGDARIVGPRQDLLRVGCRPRSRRTPCARWTGLLLAGVWRTSAGVRP